MAAAAALFTFIYFFERDVINPLGSNGTQHVLLKKLQPALVSRIEVQVGTNSVALDRSNNTWRVTSPVSYPARQELAKDFLDRCADLNWSTSIPATELAKSPHGLADYGLKPPHAQIVLVQNDQRMEVNIGNETPVGGQRYVQLGDEITAYLVDAKIGLILPQSSYTWRDPSLMPFASLAFNRIEVHAGSRVMEFTRDDSNQVWRITKPFVARADNVRIKGMIQQWRTWPVAGFVSDNPPVTELERFGFKPPELELLLGQGTNTIFGLQFGNTFTDNPDYIFAFRSANTNLVLTPQSLLEPLRGVITEFRDRRLLTFPTNAPDYIDVQSDERFTLQRQTNGTWRVLQETNFVVDTGLVNELVMNLNNLDVIEFTKDNVTDWTSYGLAKPAHRYTLTAGGTNLPPLGTNTLVAQLDLGAVDKYKTYARRPDEASAYALLSSVAERLPRTLFDLRDRRVWKFGTNEVTRISIQQEGRKFELVRNEKTIWAIADGFQGSVNPFAVDEGVFRLSEMRAVRWVARGVSVAENYGITGDSHGITLTLKRNGGPEEKLMLRIGNLTPKRDAYAAVVMDGQTVVFEMPRDLYDYITQYLNAPKMPRSSQ